MKNEDNRRRKHETRSHQFQNKEKEVGISSHNMLLNCRATLLQDTVVAVSLHGVQKQLEIHTEENSNKILWK